MEDLSWKYEEIRKSLDRAYDEAFQASQREYQTKQHLQAQELRLTQQIETLERQLQSAKEESARLATEMKADGNLVGQMEKSLEDVRLSLKSTQNELKQTQVALSQASARATAASAKANAVASKPIEAPRSANPAAVASARVEILGLRKALETAVEERDASRHKVEALERLIEAVRARSRELAEQLLRLKGQSM